MPKPLDSSATPRATADRSAAVTREAAFHDALIGEREPTASEPTAPDAWELAILDAIEPVAGLRVLDIGCGVGDLSIHLADRGAAAVTAIDVSPAAIRFASRRAEHFRAGAAVEFLVRNAEATDLPAESFDIVVGKFALHHLEFGSAVAELHRLLRPGGRGAFIETSGLNPMALAVRTHIVHRGRFGAVQVGTDDERPLTRHNLSMLRARFPQSKVDYPIFWLFRPFARQLLASRYPTAGHRIQALDELLAQRWPALGCLSYHMRIVIVKQG